MNKVIVASCSLHNYLRASQDQTYWPLQMADKEDTQDGTILNGQWRHITQGLPSFRAERSVNNPSKNALQLRNKYCEYFNGEGAVSWQLKMIT